MDFRPILDPKRDILGRPFLGEKLFVLKRQEHIPLTKTERDREYFWDGGWEVILKEPTTAGGKYSKTGNSISSIGGSSLGAAIPSPRHGVKLEKQSGD